MKKPGLHQSTGEMDWSDLRTVLAIVRGGGLSGAARDLGTQHSTVFRRLEAIEARLGVKLFERGRSGYRPTAHGDVIADAARTMEDAALAAERRVQGADARLAGTIRIATSEVLASYLLPRLLGDFLNAHPDIELELTVSNRQVDLQRREADLALRATIEPSESLVGRRLATLQYAIFATADVLQSVRIPSGRAGAGQKPPPLESLPWVGFDSREGDLQIMRALREMLPSIRPRLRADSLMTMLRMAATGAGAVVLPAFAGAQEPCLIRITPVFERPTMDLWLLHHPDVRGNARVRALMQHLADTVPDEITRLVNEGPSCAQRPKRTSKSGRNKRFSAARSSPQI